jgi:tetratricopeptide (TPR) repeat protein
MRWALDASGNGHETYPSACKYIGAGMERSAVDRHLARALKPLAALLALALLGCASTSRSLTNLTPAAWEAEVRRRGVDPGEVSNPLQVTETMREEAARMAGLGSPVSRLDRLQLALFDQREFPFSYQLRTTLTAAEAFHRRQGNCLSFTNLFIALARSVGVPVSMGLVLKVRSSEKEGDLIVVNNHVVAVYLAEGSTRYYDFDRSRRDRPAQFKQLDDLWITALYLNNRGADELRSGHPDSAASLFQNAVRLAPEFAFAWGNLGVAKRRLSDTTGALDAYGHALELVPDNPTILSNLAGLFRSLGRDAEARTAMEAASLSAASPHQLMVRGDLELSRGRIDSAVKFYKKARGLAPKLPEIYVAIARAELARQRPDVARKNLTRALKLDPGNVEATALMASLDPPARGA